jgi:hypothetical protein
MKQQRCAMLASVIGMVMSAGTMSADDHPHAYRRLVPGETTLGDVLAALGPPPIKTRNEDDLRYPVPGKPGLSDRLYFRGGVLALVTSASDDPRYPNRAAIEGAFGKPEAEVVFRTQAYLDFSEHGLKFICDDSGHTTGVIYFAPTRRRVPRGYPNERIDPTPPPRTDEAVLDAPPDSRVGAARRKITPVSLNGLSAERVEGLHVAEDLFARAAVFQCGEERIVLAGLDVFGLGLYDVDRIRNRLAEKGLDQVVVAMSHTHANADTIGFYGFYPREYADFIVEQTVQAVLEANADLRPLGELRLGSVEMPLAGGRVVDLIRNGRDPGLVDPTVSVIEALDGDGRPIVNVINLACHPEVIDLGEELGLSPDYVGTLCSEVTERAGGECVFLNGSLGGMLTPDTRFRTQAAAEEMGRRLAEFVVQAVHESRPSGYSLGWYHRPVQYPITAESVRTFLENAPWPVELIDGRVATEMNVVWIGDAQLITVPGELLPDIGFEIMSHMRGRLRLIVGLANAELGYLIPSFDFRAGHYEERTGPGAAGGEITRSVGLELAPWTPPAE